MVDQSPPFGARSFQQFGEFGNRLRQLAAGQPLRSAIQQGFRACIGQTDYAGGINGENARRHAGEHGLHKAPPLF